MSLGVDFDRYLFDHRLKQLQDKVLSLNYRSPINPSYNQSQFPSEPQYLNQQYYPRIQYAPPQQMQHQQTQDDDTDDEEEYYRPTQQTYMKSVTPSVSKSQIQTTQRPNNYIQQQQQQMLEQLMRQEAQQEQRLLQQLEEQNKAILRIAKHIKQDQKKKTKEQQRILDEEMKQLEIKRIQKELTQRQDAALKNLKNEIIESIDTQYPPMQYQQHEPYFNNYPSQHFHSYQQYQQSQQSLPQVQFFNQSKQYQPESRRQLSMAGLQSMRKIDSLLNELQ